MSEDHDTHNCFNLGKETAKAVEKMVRDAVRKTAGIPGIGEKSISAAERFGNEVTDSTILDGLLKIAVDTGISTNQLVDGMLMLEKAGHPGTDGLNVLQEVAESHQGKTEDLGSVVERYLAEQREEG